MPNPTRAQLHVNRPLTNISVAYQQTNNYICDKVFPIIPVTKQGNTYYIYDIGDAYRTEAKKRKPGTESAGTGWRTSTDSYFCHKWAVHQDISQDDRDNADEAINLDRDATEHVTQDILISREVDWASSYFTTSLWTGSTTGSDITPTNLWDTVASTPIEDIRAQARNIQQNTGFKPNTLVLGVDVYDALVDHPDILDRIKYTQKGIVTPELLASLFEVDRLFVAEAIRNSGAEEGTDSFDYINTAADALLCYSAPRPGLRVPSAGYTFVWTGRDYAGNVRGTRVKKFYLKKLDVDRIETEIAYDHKQIGATLGAFFSTVVS